MLEKSDSGPFPPLSEHEKGICSNLRSHVFMLADEIGERNIWLPQKLACFLEEKETGFI